MAKARKDKNLRSPKRGAFPVPADVLAAAAQYHPPDRATEPSPSAPEEPSPDPRPADAQDRPKSDEEEEEEEGR